MRMNGCYHIINKSTGEKLILPNAITNEGEVSFLKQIFQADNTDVPSGSNWFIGLMGSGPLDESSGLADISDEIPVLNGYARQPVVRSAVGWPTISEVAPHQRILSQSVDFTASGGDFANTFSRLFLCNVVSGTSGILYSFTAAAPAPIQIVDTQVYAVSYEMYLS